MSKRPDFQAVMKARGFLCLMILVVFRKSMVKRGKKKSEQS